MKIAIVIAHPDDETLWCASLPLRFPQHEFHVICCSIPEVDPIRAEQKLFDACKVLGIKSVTLLTNKDVFGTSLANLTAIDLSGYDHIVTHNEWGEYGHPHHKQVHEYVRNNFPHPKLFFGYRKDGVGHHKIYLTKAELDKKLDAIYRYNHNRGPSQNNRLQHDIILNWVKRELGGYKWDVETFDGDFICE